MLGHAGLPERGVPRTPEEAKGIHAQCMQISLEAARDRAGLAAVNREPPQQPSGKMKALIYKVGSSRSWSPT